MVRELASGEDKLYLTYSVRRVAKLKDNAKLPPSAARIGGKETLGDLQT